MVATDEALARIRGDNRRALPRLATLIENDDPRGLEMLDAVYPATGAAHIIGITGPPGAGKSTLVGALIEALRGLNRRVGVIAVDPSSPLTGGAVLGDRIRMMARHADRDVFIRSMSSRGRRGGLAWATAGLVHLLDAALYETIIVETVGIGQDGADIASLADTVVLVEAPGLGDGVQAIKSGLLEVGDVVVVNKSDQPGADEAIRVLRASFALGHGRTDWRVPILATTSTDGSGIEELRVAIDAHASWLDASGELSLRREGAARAEVLAGLRAVLDRRLDAQVGHPGNLAELVERVARRELTARIAISAIVSGLDDPFVS